MKLTPIISEQQPSPYEEPTDGDAADRLAWLRSAQNYTDQQRMVIASLNKKLSNRVQQEYNLTDDPITRYELRGIRRIVYTTADGSDVYMHPKIAPDKNTPIIQRLIKGIERERGLSTMHDQLLLQIDKYQKIVSKHKATQALSTLDNLRTTAPSITIRPSNIPSIIKPKGKQGFANPYTLSNYSAKFAGSPFDAPLHTTQQVLLARIQASLVRNGIKPLTMMYYAKHDGKEANFAAFNADMSVVWRKYDVGGGSGQNWIYLNGVQLPTTSLIRALDEGRATRVFQTHKLIP